MAKQGLWANINRRKRLGISRPKSQSTISKKAYENMKAGFPKKKAKGGMAMDESMAHEGKELVEDIKDTTESYSRKITGEEVKPSKMFDDIEKTVTDLETGQVEKYAKGGLVKKGFPKIAKKGWK